MKLQTVPSLLKDTASEWAEDNAMSLSASLAYYAIFSLAPLIIITISIAGLVFGDEAAKGQIAQEIRQLAGDQAASAIQSIVKSTSHKSASAIAARG